MQSLLVSDRNFLTPSIQSTVGHLSAVEQICRLHISNSSIAPRRSPLLPKKRIVLPISSFERWRCFAYSWRSPAASRGE
ncbi:hypothetical protein [Nostoc sp. C110]|uniref:hypothetical protein n=1 Tax=Nostoc sp. C110 TaxID=3349876 RepID=UPI00370D2D02